MDMSRGNIWPKWRSEYLVSFDPLQLALAFHKNRIISKTTYDKIYNMSENRIERKIICSKLLNSLPRDFSVGSVLEILRRNGYDRLANNLMCVVNLKEYRISHICRTKTKPGKAAYNHFRNIKRNIHNHVWTDPATVLRRKARQLREELKHENNPIRRQCLVDILVAHLGAEIDAISIKFDNQFFSHPIFDELHHLSQHATNALIPKVVFLSRKVNAYAIGQNFEEGEQALSDAMQCATDLTLCLELVNLYYLDVVFCLWKLEFYPSRELRSSLIEKAKTGLDLLQYENEDIQLYLTRMFFIRMASGLLGIGNRGNIYHGYIIEDEDIMAAKRFLAEVDRLWQGIELRQEMFYSMARARLNHLDGEVNLASRYAKRGLELAKEAQFREAEFIEKYCVELELLVENSSLLSRAEIHVPISLCGVPTRQETPMTATNSNCSSLRPQAQDDIQNSQEHLHEEKFDFSSLFNETSEPSVFENSYTSETHVKYIDGVGIYLSDAEIDPCNLDSSSVLDSTSSMCDSASYSSSPKNDKYMI